MDADEPKGPLVIPLCPKPRHETDAFSVRLGAGGFSSTEREESNSSIRYRELFVRNRTPRWMLAVIRLADQTRTFRISPGAEESEWIVLEQKTNRRGWTPYTFRNKNPLGGLDLFGCGFWPHPVWTEGSNRSLPPVVPVERISHLARFHFDVRCVDSGEKASTPRPGPLPEPEHPANWRMPEVDLFQEPRLVLQEVQVVMDAGRRYSTRPPDSRSPEDREERHLFVRNRDHDKWLVLLLTDRGHIDRHTLAPGEEKLFKLFYWARCRGTLGTPVVRERTEFRERLDIYQAGAREHPVWASAESHPSEEVVPVEEVRFVARVHLDLRCFEEGVAGAYAPWPS
ncbi:MAG: hypothetical protein DIJKHBIC_04643 [Thermoanaerobaculia bacterium]|nr:hypothetical protein [Thermoanaerobaculia bacterium]